MATVLVIDDERSIRVTLGEFLRGAGHEVHDAEDAEGALKLLKRHDIDVVVSDIILPRITGVELLPVVRDIAPRAQIIMMTGEPTVDTAADALRAGAFDYLFKPIPKDAILRSVANAAKVKALDDERERLAEDNKKYQEDLERLVNERTRALQESEARYRRLVDHSPDGIAIHQGRKVVFANPTMARMLKSTPDQLVGTSYLSYVHPSFHEAVMKRSKQVVSSDHPVDRLEEVLLATDGSEVDVDVAALPFLYDDCPAVQVVVRDISQQKRLAEQLQRSQRLEAIGKLAGGVAHDFNNLLMVIMGCTQFVQEALPADSPVQADLRELMSAGMRAKALTRQLLAFSRQQVLAPVALDLDGIIADTQKMLGRLLGEDIALVFTPSRDLDLVKADPGQMEQVIVNLAVNARDAMPAGGRLTIRTANVVLGESHLGDFVDPSGFSPGPYVEVSASDTGSGMSEEVKRRIFEPFFTTKRPGEGTGLGLATVFGIIKQHHGFIAVDTTPGQGTTFRVYLPTVKTITTAGLVLLTSAEAPNGAETILFVEDDEPVRFVGVRMLEGLGYTVLAAESGEEAIRVAEEHDGAIDLLVTDVVMTGMSGKDLAEDLVAKSPGLKVLYASGYTGDRILRHGLKLDPCQILQKPFEKAGLAEKLREALDG